MRQPATGGRANVTWLGYRNRPPPATAATTGLPAWILGDTPAFTATLPLHPRLLLPPPAAPRCSCGSHHSPPASCWTPSFVPHTTTDPFLPTLAGRTPHTHTCPLLYRRTHTHALHTHTPTHAHTLHCTRALPSCTGLGLHGPTPRTACTPHHRLCRTILPPTGWFTRRTAGDPLPHHHHPLPCSTWPHSCARTRCIPSHTFFWTLPLVWTPDPSAFPSLPCLCPFGVRFGVLLRTFERAGGTTPVPGTTPRVALLAWSRFPATVLLSCLLRRRCTHCGRCAVWRFTARADLRVPYVGSCLPSALLLQFYHFLPAFCTHAHAHAAPRARCALRWRTRPPTYRAQLCRCAPARAITRSTRHLRNMPPRSSHAAHA